MCHSKVHQTRRYGIVFAATLVIAVCMVGVGAIVGGRYLPHPWNIVGPVVLTSVAGLVGAAVTWLLDAMREDERRPPADSVERAVS